MGDKFESISTHRNWCAIDHLDGNDLIAGEILDVQFPDGTIISQPIIVKQASATVSDMGVKYDIPLSPAFVNVEVYGVRIDLPLANPLIKVRRRQSD